MYSILKGFLVPAQPALPTAYYPQRLRCVNSSRSSNASLKKVRAATGFLTETRSRSKNKNPASFEAGFLIRGEEKGGRALLGRLGRFLFLFTA